VNDIWAEILVRLRQDSAVSMFKDEDEDEDESYLRNRMCMDRTGARREEALGRLQRWLCEG